MRKQKKTRHDRCLKKSQWRIVVLCIKCEQIFQDSTFKMTFTFHYNSLHQRPFKEKLSRCLIFVLQCVVKTEKRPWRKGNFPWRCAVLNVLTALDKWLDTSVIVLVKRFISVDMETQRWIFVPKVKTFLPVKILIPNFNQTMKLTVSLSKFAQFLHGGFFHRSRTKIKWKP